MDGGHCLDPKKLSYFIPEETLVEGDMIFEEIRTEILNEL